MEVPEYRITMEDVSQFHQELMRQHRFSVVLELRPVWHAKRPQYAIMAKAYRKAEELVEDRSINRTALYPTRNYPSFPDAALGALMELDGALSAHAALQAMGME